MENSTKVIDGKVLKVVSKETQKSLSIPTKKALAKVASTKVAKVKVQTIAKTKEEIAQKRKLNPQFAHVVSKQKKIDLVAFKSDGLKVFLSAKNIVKNIEIEGYNFAENINVIEKSISFINFVTKQNKQGEFLNDTLLQTILKNVRTTKTGFFNEYYFAQIVQKIVTLSITKGYNFNDALNIVIALNEKSKKAKK